MTDPTIVKVGFSLIENLPKEDKADCNHCFMLYYDPVLDIDVTWGAKPESFTLVKYEHIPGKKIREYTPFQMSVLTGLRADFVIMSLNRIYEKLYHTPDLIYRILFKSGYSFSAKELSEVVSAWKLNCIMRERPDLFERRELLEI